MPQILFLMVISVMHLSYAPHVHVAVLAVNRPVSSPTTRNIQALMHMLIRLWLPCRRLDSLYCSLMHTVRIQYVRRT